MWAGPTDGSEGVRLTEVNPWVETDLALGESRLIRWQSRDGLEIEGILTVPAGHEQGRLPFARRRCCRIRLRAHQPFPAMQKGDFHIAWHAGTLQDLFGFVEDRRRIFEAAQQIQRRFLVVHDRRCPPVLFRPRQAQLAARSVDADQ